MTVWRVWGELFVDGDDIVTAVRRAAAAFDGVTEHAGQGDRGWTISSITPISESAPPVVGGRWLPPHLRNVLPGAPKARR